jgi:uncharacterized NAD(P)/FAD-binding protein YdhS
VNKAAARHAIIIGGGASGVLLAYQLLRDRRSGFRVTLIEKRPEIGRGFAYHTSNPEHLLNVRASNMSALPDDPEHFWHWLLASNAQGSVRLAGARCPDPYCFVPRRIYGDYIASLIGPLGAGSETPARLSIIQGECVALGKSDSGVNAAMADGARINGDVAVLATGHDASTASLGSYADPWNTPSVAGLAKEAPVLVLGSGLTMVDYVLSLLLEGHQGPIVAMSRRGLLPNAHRRVESVSIDVADVPFGTDFNRLFRWFRGRIASHVEGGGDWRSVVDGIRPHTQRIWRHLSLPSKRRFLEHARAWWDVHRHRMAPEVESRIAQAIASGRLTIIAAKLIGVEQHAAGASVLYRQRGETKVASMEVARIVDCTGIIKDPMQTTNPVLLSMFEQGLARVDPLHIGIEVGSDCAIVDRYGMPSQRLFAVGPLTRAAFWEIVAIPDIRNQCAKLAARLIRTHANGATAKSGLVDAS